MKLLIDMNLSSDWVDYFARNGWEAVHWSAIGDPRAPDIDLMQWAVANEHVVFTHDLDFGTLLALTQAQAPSVIQVRTQDIMPQTLGANVIRVLRDYQQVLEDGALITIDETRSRVRILPF
jgi:predicted nuclease of predicted toxin-antitoxin system